MEEGVVSEEVLAILVLCQNASCVIWHPSGRCQDDAAKQKHDYNRGLQTDMFIARSKECVRNISTVAINEELLNSYSFYCHVPLQPVSSSIRAMAKVLQWMS